MQGYLRKSDYLLKKKITTFLELFPFKNIMTLLQIANQNYQTSQMNYHTVLLYFIFGLLISSIILLLWQVNKKIIENKLLGLKHVAEISIIRKDHSEALEKIRIEMLKREEDKSRQWIESEKETLHILGGVSTLLDLSDKFGRIESEKIMMMLEQIQDKIEKIIKAEET